MQNTPTYTLNTDGTYSLDSLPNPIIPSIIEPASHAPVMISIDRFGIRYGDKGIDPFGFVD